MARLLACTPAAAGSVQGAYPLRLLTQAIPSAARNLDIPPGGGYNDFEIFQKVSERRNNSALPMPLVMEGPIPNLEKEVSLWQTKRALPDSSLYWQMAS